MDRRNAFERQLTDEIEYEVGPRQGVDALAVTRQAKSTTPGWRFSMSSTLKFAALSVALAVAGTAIFLVESGGPGDGVAQPGAESAAQVEVADPGPAAYVQGYVTGLDWSGEEAETYDDDGDRLTLRGTSITGTAVMDDPRMEGAFEMTLNIDEFPQPDMDQRVEVQWGDVSIANDEGSWSGTYEAVYDSSQFPDEVQFILIQLTGADAYGGLSALLSYPGTSDPESGEWDIALGGVVYPGPLPPASAHAE